MNTIEFNDIPVIGFRNNNKKKEKIISFLNNNAKSYLTINYIKTSDNFLFFLKDSLTELNLVEDLDYAISYSDDIYNSIELLNEKIEKEDFLLKKTNFENLLKSIVSENITFKEEVIIMIIEEEYNKKIVGLLQKLNNETKLKVIYLSTEMPTSDIKFQSNFSIEEETDIRNYIETLYEIDSDKLTRMISNYVYHEILSSNKKVFAFNEYQKVLNDVEENLMKSLFEKKEEIINQIKKTTNVDLIEEDLSLIEEENNENINIEEDKNNEITGNNDSNSLIQISIFIVIVIIIGTLSYIIV